jgi:tetratricopeptide (TPR) repeat protein
MTGSREDDPRDEALEPQQSVPESDELDGEGPALLPLLDTDAGPALALSERQLALLADRVERQFARRARPVRRWPARRVWAAAGLFAASAAAAVYSVGVLQREPASPASGSPASGSPASGSPASGSPASADSVPPVPAPRAPEAAPPAPEVAAPESVAPPAPSEVPPEKAPRQAEERPAELPAVAPKSNTPASGKVPASRSVVADRLAQANGLRARHRYREALALYLQVIEIAPNRMQASVARVAAAELQLEQFGDVAGAERLYREAKTQGGELTAEAQFGLARVARARGDAAEERRALGDFLQRYPESPLTAAARRRLNALGDK